MHISRQWPNNRQSIIIVVLEANYKRYTNYLLHLILIILIFRSDLISGIHQYQLIHTFRRRCKILLLILRRMNVSCYYDTKVSHNKDKIML